VRFSAANESLLFETLGRTSPAERRKQLADYFRDAAAAAGRKNSKLATAQRVALKMGGRLSGSCPPAST
jgi:hypothetical protein